jgi:hypothetical protein
MPGPAQAGSLSSALQARIAALEHEVQQGRRLLETEQQRREWAERQLRLATAGPQEDGLLVQAQRVQAELKRLFAPDVYFETRSALTAAFDAAATANGFRVTQGNRGRQSFDMMCDQHNKGCPFTCRARGTNNGWHVVSDSDKTNVLLHENCQSRGVVHSLTWTHFKT